MNHLAKKIKALRKKHQMTQLVLAQKSGLSHAYIGRLEIGQYDPQLSTLKKLAKALKCSASELVD